MAEAKRIDGKVFAEKLRDVVANQVRTLKDLHGLTPGLAVVLVGNDPASEIYVRNKHKMTTYAGMKSFEHKPPRIYRSKKSCKNSNTSSIKTSCISS